MIFIIKKNINNYILNIITVYYIQTISNNKFYKNKRIKFTLKFLKINSFIIKQFKKF